MPSGNDAANAIAEHISGSISSFANLMNDKASELKLEDTHFTNPSGIHDENLYSTAYDLSIIARYAMKFSEYRKIAKAVTYTLPKTNIYPSADRTLRTTNLLLDPSQKNYYYKYAIGVKTGFTDEAGDCLAAAAEKDDITFITIVLNGSTKENGLREKFLDCKTLFDFAFDNYTTYYKKMQYQIAKLSIQGPKKEENTKTLSIFESTDSLRLITKIIAVIILLISIKLIFFNKKKNRRKRR